MHELIIHLFEFQEICNLKYTLGRSPIVVDNVKIALADYPDKEAAFRLLHGLEYGFKLNYSGPRIPFIMHTRDLNLYPCYTRL